MIVDCPRVLASLLATCPGVDAVIPSTTPADQFPRFDVHAPVMSLPRIVGTTLQNIPADVPYLFADPAQVAHWRENLAGEKRLKIGVAWHGNPRQPRDHHRSMPLKRLAPLAAMQDVQLYSLQRGFGTDQLNEMKNTPLASLAIPLDPALANGPAMSELAAVMMNMDLIVSVDTAVAHLAVRWHGPHGCFCRTADWRYKPHRHTTPWYPTMRLFRQRRLDHWRPAVASLCSALARFKETRAAGK